MNWDNKTVIKFLELYQMNPCIWDPGNEGHKNRQRVNDAWNIIKDNLGVPCSLQDLKKKKESLMSAYRGYKSKIKKSERSGSGAADVYQPSWFAFAFMDSFLNPVNTCKSTINTVDEEPTFIEDLNSEQDPTDQNTRSQEHQDLSEQHGVTARPILNRRRQNNPPELIQAKKRMDEAYSFMQYHSQRQQKDEDDECSTFGVLVARKLRKLSEERRDIMMGQIHQLFINEHVYNFSLANYSSSRPNSASTMLSYTPSPVQINIASPPAVASTPEAASPPAVASSPEAAFPTEVESLNCVKSHPNSTSVSYMPSSPQTDAPSPAYYVEYSNNDMSLSLPNLTSGMVSYTQSPLQSPLGNHTVTSPTTVAPLNCAQLNSHKNSTTKVPYTPSSQPTDAPAPAYYIEYSNDISYLQNPTSGMVSYTQSPLQTPRENHTVTSPTAVSYQRPNTKTRNTVSEGTRDVLKDFVIMRRK